MRKELMVITLLSMVQLIAIPLSSQSGVYVQIEPRDPCTAGFPCEVNVSITNSDGTILLNKLKLTTPWGIFVKDLGLRELKGGESLRIPILINVSIDSLEGPNFMRPELIYFVKGGVGLRSSVGNSSSVLIQRLKVSVSLLASPLSYNIDLGDPLVLEGSYRVEGVPKEFKPTLTVYVNRTPLIERIMNSTHGLFSIPVPLSIPGVHEVNLTLSYGIGQESKVFTVIVSSPHRGYSKEDLFRELNSTKRDFQSLLTLYRSAINDLIPVPTSVISNMSAIDSLLAEAEAKLSSNLSYGDALRIGELLNRSKELISIGSNTIAESYRGKLLSDISGLREELSPIADVDESTYRNVSSRLDSIEEEIRSISSYNAPTMYKEISGEIERVKELIRSKREKILADVVTLAAVLMMIFFVSIISITTLILRRWRKVLRGEVS
ncbi:MAG: hypothetical protein NZ992_02760 [Candidatus Korarchaeum sp.]|nr:hypothetical protein [Candidatus Korarchaeum sp.]MDW8036257.1 hypothetical protein [Candidatus Korarchaeum sp.]